MKNFYHIDVRFKLLNETEFDYDFFERYFEGKSFKKPDFEVIFKMVEFSFVYGVKFHVTDGELITSFEIDLDNKDDLEELAIDIQLLVNKYLERDFEDPVRIDYVTVRKG